MLSVLAHPIYARLFAAQVIALLGTGLMTVALGTALAIKMIAYVRIAPLAKTWNRRCCATSASTTAN